VPGGFQLLNRAITARQQHLLTDLALQRDVPVLRQQIAGQFWPDVPLAANLSGTENVEAWVTPQPVVR
jgi:DNA-binding SARP family transcriptional activator